MTVGMSFDFLCFDLGLVANSNKYSIVILLISTHKRSRSFGEISGRGVHSQFLKKQISTPPLLLLPLSRSFR